MVEWLEDNGSGNDEDVWGYRKTTYHFSDLKEWLEEKKKAIGKGKQKEKEKKKKEAKKNLVDTVKQRK
jgi:hypothetical protein